jgi:hypothetical protein
VPASAARAHLVTPAFHRGRLDPGPWSCLNELPSVQPVEQRRQSQDNSGRCAPKCEALPAEQTAERRWSCASSAATSAVSIAAAVTIAALLTGATGCQALLGNPRVATVTVQHPFAAVRGLALCLLGDCTETASPACRKQLLRQRRLQRQQHWQCINHRVDAPVHSETKQRAGQRKVSCIKVALPSSRRSALTTSRLTAYAHVLGAGNAGR